MIPVTCSAEGSQFDEAHAVAVAQLERLILETLVKSARASKGPAVKLQHASERLPRWIGRGCLLAMPTVNSCTFGLRLARAGDLVLVRWDRE